MTNATEVRERPILFSGEMVRALLNGTKTQTRRVIADKFLGECVCAAAPIELQTLDCQFCHGDKWHHLPSPEQCPYGQPGDRLWVRETFATYRDDTPEEAAKKSAASEAWCKSPSMEGLIDFAKLPGRSGPERALYAADFAESLDSVDWTWKPSIHMPRWASRISSVR